MKNIKRKWFDQFEIASQLKIKLKDSKILQEESGKNKSSKGKINKQIIVWCHHKEVIKNFSVDYYTYLQNKISKNTSFNIFKNIFSKTFFSVNC